MFDFIPKNWFIDQIRIFFAAIDSIIYQLIRLSYNIFFIVTDAQIISGDTIRDFYSRIQIILGIIIMFKVAISIFNGILNPESVSDKKSGTSGVVKRIIIVLVMLTLIVPLNIPESDIDDVVDGGQKSWNARMNENGILFGTMFELQSRLLSQNTIGKLILGVNGSNESDSDSPGQILSAVLLKSFITINPKDDFSDPEHIDSDRVCPAEDDEDLQEAYDTYLDDDLVGNWSGIFNILSLTNIGCDDGEVQLFGLDILGDRDYYAFSYMIVVSTVVGIFSLLIIISFTVDAAIRLFKLAILRLISPIAVISYFDPKTEGTFTNWWKITLQTYLDLFIRLAIVNLMIFFIREFFQNAFDFIQVPSNSILIKIFAKLFIYLGLLMFAKKAPKFIMDALGMKSSQGLFGGLASLIGGVSSGINSFKAAKEKYMLGYDNLDANGNPQPTNFNGRGRAKALGSALFNGIANTGNAYSDYSDAKGNRFRAAMDPITRANAYRRENASAGVGWWDSFKEQARKDFTGDSEFDQLKREKAALERDYANNKQNQEAISRRQQTIKSAMAAFSDEVKKKGAQFSLSNYTFTDTGNNTHTRNINSNLKDLEAAYERGKVSGDYVVDGYHVSAATFGEIYAKAIDDSTQRFISGSAKYANGNDMRISDSAELKAMRDEVVRVMASDATTYSQVTGNQYNANTIVDTLLADSKKMSTYYAAESYNLQNQLPNLQSRISEQDEKIRRAEYKSRGSDGRSNGKS